MIQKKVNCFFIQVSNQVVNVNIKQSRGEGAALLHSTLNKNGGGEVVIYFYGTTCICIQCLYAIYIYMVIAQP